MAKELTKKNDFPQGIVAKDREYADINLKDRKESRILWAFDLTRKDLDSAIEPSLFRSLENGQAFIVKYDERVTYVAVKLNGHNAGGGDNSVAIGGKYSIFGGYHDFDRSGSLVVGIPLNQVVFPVPGKVFTHRERRALRHA